MQLPGALSTQVQKTTPKRFLTFQEMKISDSKIKRFPIFSQKKAFLTFPVISSQAQKIKKNLPWENFLYSRNMELSNSKIKKLHIFQETEAP